jgi:exopolysaccharide production protein ExoQ
VVMTLLIALGLFVLAQRSGKVARILAKNKWLIILFVYICLSIVWSNFPGMSARRGIRSVGTFVMVLVVLSEANPLETVRVLLTRLYCVHIPLSILAIKYYRSIGVMYDWSGTEEQWTGLSIDKNSLGQVAMCACVFFLWRILQDWPKKKFTLNVPMFFMSLWILRGSKNIHSSAAILGFLICALVLLVFQLLRKRPSSAKRFVFGGGLVGAVLCGLVYLAFALFNARPLQAVVQASGRDMTFTDRNLIWMDVLNNAKKSPVLGVGIGAYWVGDIGNDKYPMPHWSAKTPEWRPQEGHNGFIDVYAELGAVGEALFLIVVATAFVGVFNEIETNFLFGTLRLSFLLAVISNNMAETSFLKGTHDLWFLFLLFAVNLPRPIRKSSPARIQTSSLDQLESQRRNIRAEVIVSSSTSPAPSMCGVRH